MYAGLVKRDTSRRVRTRKIDHLATETDNARVVVKAQRTRRARPAFIIEAKGRYSYREDVSARIFRTIQAGDTLHVSLTPVFTEWKTMEVVRNGTVVAATRGPELSGMGAMGLLLLVQVWMGHIERM